MPLLLYTIKIAKILKRKMEIHLDSQIRDWVLIPIFLVMILLSLLRNVLGENLMKKDKPEADAFFGESVMARTGRFKNNY